MNKKKGLILAVLAVLMTGSLFAANYVVESVTGKVTYEATPGSWKDVTVGQELSDSTVINTGLNSTLVISVSGTKVTIKAMQKGTLDSLASAAGGAKGLKKGPAVAKDTTADATTTQKGVVTASSRASEAKEDLDWDEE